MNKLVFNTGRKRGKYMVRLENYNITKITNDCIYYNKYEESEKKIYNLTHEMNGIDIINSKTIYKIEVLEKSLRQCTLIVTKGVNK